MAFTQLRTRYDSPNGQVHPAEYFCPNATVTLDDLSNEILLKVMRYVPIHRSGRYSARHYLDRPLVTVSHCSRRLYHIASSVLYTYFIEEYTGNPNALQLFLKRIIHRPDLAAVVEFYHGSARDCKVHGFHLDVTCFGQEDWDKINNRVNEVCRDAEMAARWIESIQKGYWDSITALTLTLTPNIKELVLDNWRYNNNLYPTLMQHLVRIQKLQKSGNLNDTWSMRHLNRVRLDYWDTQGGMNLVQLQPFLAIPSIKTFWGK
jgi:hypothetical protein